VLNIAFLVVAAVLVARCLRPGGDLSFLAS
jgi:hypothetical protein